MVVMVINRIRLVSTVVELLPYRNYLQLDAIDSPNSSARLTVYRFHRHRQSSEHYCLSEITHLNKGATNELRKFLGTIKNISDLHSQVLQYSLIVACRFQEFDRYLCDTRGRFTARWRTVPHTHRSYFPRKAFGNSSRGIKYLRPLSAIFILQPNVTYEAYTINHMP